MAGRGGRGASQVDHPDRSGSGRGEGLHAARHRPRARRPAAGAGRAGVRPAPKGRGDAHAHRVGPPAAHTPSPTATGSATATALVVPLRSAATTPMITIAATETIAAPEDHLPQSWPTAEGPLEELPTLAPLPGEDRALPAALATALRHRAAPGARALP